MLILLLLTAALPFISYGKVPPGGFRHYYATATDPVVAFALEGINEYFKEKNDSGTRQLEKIVESYVQIIAGARYIFVLQLFCGDDWEICTVTVLSKPWLDKENAFRIEGEPACIVDETTRGPKIYPFGGTKEIDQSDPSVQGVFRFLENLINKESNSSFYLVATEASKVYVYLLNGATYDVKNLKFVESNCTKEDVKHNSRIKCLASNDSGPTEESSFNVFWNPKKNHEYHIMSQDWYKPYE